MKKTYIYIQILNHENKPKLVTSIDWVKKVAVWDDDKKPMTFSYSEALDLAWGLCINWITATVLTSLFKIEEQL